MQKPYFTFIKIITPLIIMGILAGPVQADERLTRPLEPLYSQQVKLEGFWKEQVKRLTEKWLPHCIEQMEEGGRGEELLNLINAGKCLKGQEHGEYTGLVFADAYVHNVIESICLALTVDAEGDAELANAQLYLYKKMNEWIPIVLAAQWDDGYIHSFHTIKKQPRYTRINDHEFYVQGYFIEAGIAHYKTTGGKDTRLFDAARKCADHICETFDPEKWTYGHAGMGIAMSRMARQVDEIEGKGRGDKYAEVMKFLFNTRHENHPHAYRQSHRPVVEMERAVGHAVRGTYFYAGIADLAMLTDDEHYLAAADRIWHNAIHKKHYVTGGVGASHRGEAFAEDYELPNTGYCESCAACGMTFWADRMHRIHRHAHYFDIQERALYNAILGALELSGKNFFYQNPLKSDKHRYPWHNCPCCVGNIPRALIAIKDQAYRLSPEKDTLYVNHYLSLETTIPAVAGEPLTIIQKTDYPWQGDIRITLKPGHPAAFTIKLRIPDRTESEIYTAVPDISGQHDVSINGIKETAEVQNGYITLQRKWKAGDTINLSLPMPIQRVYADEVVKANRGRVALIRGPLVYNIEDVDNDGRTRSLVLKPETPLDTVWHEDLLEGVMTIEGIDSDFFAIPNYTRLNRGGWSQVWILENPEKVRESEPLYKTLKPFLDRTIDAVKVNSDESESAHNLQGENTNTGSFQETFYRHAFKGWFSYDLQVNSNTKNYLAVCYWGNERLPRTFDIDVNGHKLTTQTLHNDKPGHFFVKEYAIPKEVTAGKNKITVKFTAAPNSYAGGIFDIRTLKK